MTPTYHIVSHTHWDREWYRSFEQFRAQLVAMIDHLLDLLDSTPGFEHFTLDGQTIVLEDYLAVKPENRERLSRRVQEGRILIGPWYVLPDEFLVSGEALLRNLFAGRRIAAAYGEGMNIAYIPDSFGHIAMMPSIVRGFGMDAALVYRGFGGEPGQEKSEYWWDAPDGSRCLMIHLPRNGYSAAYFHQDDAQQVLDRFRALKEELDARATTSQRLALNGGDHHWADPRLPGTLDLLRANFEGDIVHSTVPAYVAAVSKEIRDLTPILGELRFGYRYAFTVLGGVYSSRIYLKQKNWELQNLLQRYAEPLAAAASLRQGSSRLASTRHAWGILLQNHPHDSICGCSIDPVHREMMTRFASAKDAASAVVQSSLEELLPVDDRAYQDDRYLYVFNPSPFARSEVVEAGLNFYQQDVVVGLNPDVTPAPKRPPVSGFVLLDEQGKEVPCQILDRAEAYDIAYSHFNYPKQSRAERFRVLLGLADVPPLGFSRLTVRRAPRFPRFPNPLRTGPGWIENEFLRVQVDGRGLTTILDKESGVRYRGLNCFEDTGDVGDEYNYSYPRRDRRVLSSRAKARVRLVERGPLRATLEASLTLRLPRAASADRQGRSRQSVAVPIRIRVSLDRGCRFVSFETSVVNRATDHRLRVLFPTGARSSTALADSQFTIVRRTRQAHDLSKFTIEYPAKVAPMQRFVSVAGAGRGLTLMSSGLPEYEMLPDATLALTLLRCVGTLAGENLLTRPGGKAGWHNDTPDAQCPGSHTFRYALLPAGQAPPGDTASLNDAAERFHLPLLPVRRKNAEPSPAPASLCSLADGAVVLSALKEAEDGNGLILRLSNPGAAPAEAVLRFGPAVKQAWLSRLDEQTVEPVAILDEHEIRVRCGPSALLTMRLIM